MSRSNPENTETPLTEIEKMYYAKFLRRQNRVLRLYRIAAVIIATVWIHVLISIPAVVIVEIVVFILKRNKVQEIVNNAKITTLRGRFLSRYEFNYRSINFLQGFFFGTKDKPILFQVDGHVPNIQLRQIVKQLKADELIEIDAVLTLPKCIFDLRRVS